MNPIQLYGIKNCDTVRKARRWLESNQIDFEFVDLRANTLSDGLIESWITQVGLGVLLNKSSTSWRALSADRRDNLTSENAIALFLEHPTLIKRPVLIAEGDIHVGFNTDKYQNLFFKETS